MTRRDFMLKSVSAVAGISLLETGCTEDPGLVPLPSWAVSLRVLQSQVRSIQSEGQAVPDHLASMCNLTRISSLFFANNDIILTGDREQNGTPSFKLDQLAVALKNAYAVDERYTGTVGCTIDPQPGPGGDIWVLQLLKTFGSPHHSSLSRLFGEIDYTLKSAGAGYVKIPGVQSAFELSEKSPCSSGGNYQAVHRYWFTPKYPPAPRFVEDGAAFWIKRPIEVKLQTEEEFLNSRGERLGGGSPRPSASKFANEMTQVLATNDFALAAQTRQAFRLIELAQLICLKGARESIDFLLSGYQEEEYNVPMEVRGIVRQKTTSQTCGMKSERSESGIVKQQQIATLTQDYRGGVTASINLTRPQFGTDKRRGLQTARELILRARPSSESLEWQIA